MQIFSKEYFSQYKRNWALAYPLMIVQSMQMVMHIVDNIMVGRLGSMSLAGVTYANSVFALFLFIAIGLSLGLTPLVGKANGEGNVTKLKIIFNTSLTFHIIFAFVFCLGIYSMSFVLDYFEQEAQVVTIAKPFYKLICLSMIPAIIFGHFKHFLEGMKIIKPAANILIISNILNIIFNYLFIYGNYGFPALGTLGSAVSTCCARFLQLVMILGYYCYHCDLFHEYFKHIRLKIDWRVLADFIKLGAPIALQLVAEVAYFSFGGIMVGYFGAAALAGHAIALNIISLNYLLASGFSGAATISVSNFHGEKKFRKVQVAAFSSALMTVVFMSFCTVAIILSRYQIPLIYLEKTEVEAISMAANLLILGAVFELFDGMQVISLGILRGLHDVKIPSLICVLSYWVVGFSASYLLSVKLGFGAQGVWDGYILSLACAATLLGLRSYRAVKQLDVC
ncbi:MAG: MATE family efflux transporter [Deltaproteobacteria bacterium]|nr:MATE family efflux transporter [Deltaproteobacteria bacterium]